MEARASCLFPKVVLPPGNSSLVTRTIAAEIFARPRNLPTWVSLKVFLPPANRFLVVRAITAEDFTLPVCVIAVLEWLELGQRRRSPFEPRFIEQREFFYRIIQLTT